jgi:hypothetical protein
MPFPAAGPTTKDLVKAHLTIGDDADDTFIEGVVGAVNDYVKGLPIAQVADTDPAPGDWAALPRVILGATMLAARLVRRRGTPDGVAAFSEGAPVYVRRNDPDVAQMLSVGQAAKPRVG